MKNKTTTIVITICTLALLLSACTSGATTATSWGGATITDTAVYYADGGQLYALKVENGIPFGPTLKKLLPLDYSWQPLLSLAINFWQPITVIC